MWNVFLLHDANTGSKKFDKCYFDDKDTSVHFILVSVAAQLTVDTINCRQ